MPRNAFTLAKVCLGIGCLLASTTLIVARPRGSNAFLVSHESRRAGTVVSNSADSLPARDDLSSHHSSDTLGPASPVPPTPREENAVTLRAEPPGDRLAANDARVPLAGVRRRARAATPAETPVTAYAADEATHDGLVPEPTLDPALIPPIRFAREDEIRSLRQEVRRSAQLGSAAAEEIDSDSFHRAAYENVGHRFDLRIESADPLLIVPITNAVIRTDALGTFVTATPRSGGDGASRTLRMEADAIDRGTASTGAVSFLDVASVIGNAFLDASGRSIHRDGGGTAESSPFADAAPVESLMDPTAAGPPRRP